LEVVKPKEKRRGMFVEQFWSELFTKADIQLICVGGFYIAFFSFAKYMEFRQYKKETEDQ
jgi:hypothetical protein